MQLTVTQADAHMQDGIVRENAAASESEWHVSNASCYIFKDFSYLGDTVMGSSMAAKAEYGKWNELCRHFNPDGLQIGSHMHYASEIEVTLIVPDNAADIFKKRFAQLSILQEQERALYDEMMHRFG